VPETEFKLNRVETTAGLVALVTMDNGADYTKPTVLARGALESADRVLAELESGEWAAMVLTGKPFVFCAGADIDEFPKVSSREEAIAGSRSGHDLFGRIRALPFPTVAAINGACLGGGVEIALHCDARTISTSVRHFALPECFLGIVPGWGGTQFVPRLVDPKTAIRFVVQNPMRQNRMLTGPEAVDAGLADRLLEPVEFVDESIALAVELVETGGLERDAPDLSGMEEAVRRARAGSSIVASPKYWRMAALAAIRRAGIVARSRQIRGGSSGAADSRRMLAIAVRHIPERGRLVGTTYGGQRGHAQIHASSDDGGAVGC